MFVHSLSFFAAAAIAIAVQFLVDIFVVVVVAAAAAAADVVVRIFIFAIHTAATTITMIMCMNGICVLVCNGMSKYLSLYVCVCVLVCKNEIENGKAENCEPYKGRASWKTLKRAARSIGRTPHATHTPNTKCVLRLKYYTQTHSQTHAHTYTRAALSRHTIHRVYKWSDTNCM